MILAEDLDLLHELSKFSNYFPMEQVMTFFEGIILNEDKLGSTTAFAIKRYADIISKGFQMKSHRKDIIRNLISKLKTHNINRVVSCLNKIFEGIAVG